MGVQREMLWALLGLSVCLLSEPGLAAALPVATEWPDTETDDFTATDHLSWGTSSDYFDPTMPTTTEEAFMIQSTAAIVAAGGTSEEDPGTARADNPSSPAEEEMQNSGLASEVNATTRSPNQIETRPPGEETEETTEVHVMGKEGLAKGNSSNTPSGKGAIQTVPAVSDEVATLPVLESTEVPSTFWNERPGAPELLTDTYGLRDVSSLPPASGREETLDAATGETNADSEPNPTLASWEDAPDAITEPKEETPQPFLDAGREAVAPTSIPVASPSNTEELPVEVPGATPADDGHSILPAPGDDNAAEGPTPSFGPPPPDVLPPSNTPSGSSESGGPAVVSIQQSPSSKDNLVAEPAVVEGRGDSDSPGSATVPDRDGKPTALSSLEELGPEGSGDLIPEGSEDLTGAEASNSSLVGDTRNLPPGINSPSGPPSRSSDLDSGATVASPVGLSMAPGYSSLLPEDDEIQTVSVTKEEAEEGSGTTSSNEIPFTVAFPHQEQRTEPPEGGVSATEAPKGDVSGDLKRGTVSPLKPGEETASSELAENGQAAVSVQSEIIPSSSESTPVNSAEMAGEEPEGLSDIKGTSASALEDETAIRDQGAPGETAFPPSLSGTSSEREGEGDSLSATPGNSGSLSEGSTMVPEPGVSSGSATNEERDSTTDFPPSDAELGPAEGTQLPVGGSGLLKEGSSSSPSPIENTVVSESDTADAPSSSSPGSPVSSQPEGSMQSGSEVMDGSQEPEDSAAAAAVNGKEASSATPATDAGSPIEGATFSGTNGEVLSSGDEVIGAASESKVNKEAVSETSNDLDEIHSLPSEPGLNLEKGMVTNTRNFEEITDDGSGDFSPLIAGSGTSTKVGGLSVETSSSTPLDGTSSEAEKGEDLGSSPPGSEVPGGSRDKEGSPGLPANEGDVTNSDESQTGAAISEPEPGSSEGAEPPVGSSGALASGEISDQSLLEEGETSVTAAFSGGDFSSASASSAKNGETSATSVASGEDSPSVSGNKSSSFISKSSGVQPSILSKYPDSYQPASDDALKSGPVASEVESQELKDTSSVAGKEASLDPSAAESQTVLPSTETLGSAGSSLEDGEEPQQSPDDAASEAAERPEDSSSVKEETSMAPSATVSPSAPDGVEMNGFPVAGNEGSQFSPGDTPKMGSESGSEAEEEPEDTSTMSGVKSSATEGEETSFSGAAVGSQPFPDGATKDGAVADPGVFDEVEQWEGSSPVNKEETPPGSSSTESPGTSGDEDVSGGLGKGRPFLSAEGVEAATSAASKGPQPSPNSATAGPGDFGGVKLPEVSSSISENKASLAPLAAESHSASSSAEGVETASAGAANDGGVQPYPDDAEAEQPGSSSSASGKEASLVPLATGAQPDSSSPDGVKNDGLATSGSPTSTSEGAQLPPDNAAGAGSEAGEESRVVSDVSGKKSSLAIFATTSPVSSLSNEGVETSLSGLGDDVGSQPSLEAAAAAAEPGVSEEGEQRGSSSAAGEEETPSTSSATESKSLGAPLGEGSADNAESQVYGTASAGEGEGEVSQDSSTTNGKKPALSPLDTESQSPGMSAGEEVSGGLGEGESSFPTSGLDSTDMKSTSSSETGLSPENIAEHLGDKPGPMNGGEPSTQSSPVHDGSVTAIINKASGETLPSGSNSLDRTVTIQEMPSEGLGTADSSLPPSEIGYVGDNMASPEGIENSVLTLSGQPALSYSDVLGGPDSSSPVAKGDAEGLAGVLESGTVASSSVGTSLQSSGTGGMKVAIDQQSGMASSPSTSLSSSASQPFGFYDSGIESTGHVAGEPSSQGQAENAASVGKDTGKMDSFPTDLGIQNVGPSPNGLASHSDEASVGNIKDLSPTTSEGRGDTDSSVLAADKGTSTTSGEADPSLCGTPLCPVTTPQLPAVESGPGVNTGVSPQSSKVEVVEGAGDTLAGKPAASVLASSSSASSGSGATKSGSTTSTTTSSLPGSSVQSAAVAGVGKGTSGGTKASSTSKSDASLAASGVGPGAVKSSQTTSKTSDKKEVGKMSDKKEESKTSDKEVGSKKSGKQVDSKQSAKEESSKKADKKEDGKKLGNKGNSKKSDNKPDSSSQNSKKTAAANRNSATLNPGPAVSLSASLFPYGPKANDKEYVERKTDFNSPLFKPDVGVPLGKMLHDSLYFTDNGQIIFPPSGKDISSYPNPPLGGFNGRENVPMVAVFWDNADFSRGSGTIFYQEYVSENSAKHPLVRDVEAMVQQYLKSSYSARWTLKVTWVKAQPYPAQRQSGRANTYQAILTTDGYRTYTLFLYQAGGMQWDYAVLSPTNVLMGYTSGDGFFRNDDLMSEVPAVKYRPDRFPGFNTGVRGLWIYKLDSSIRVNYRQRCLDWLSNERQPAAWNEGLPRCPCSLAQGLTDDGFTRSKKGFLDSRFTMLHSSNPNQYGAGVRCLYENNNDQLVEGHQERIWKGSRRSSPINDEELKLHDWCCNQAGKQQFCDKYHQKRPKIGCDGYKPPVQATSSEEDPGSNEGD